MSDKNANELLVVIVNYRTAGLVIDCLRSLMPQAKELGRFKVVVVDNNSPDDSVQKLANAVSAENWTSTVEIMPMPINGGFAYGNNACIRKNLESATPPNYFLLLNPDTLPPPGSIKLLLNFMDEHPQAGIAGSQLVNSHGAIEKSAHTFPSPLNELVKSARLGALESVLGFRPPTHMDQSSAYQCDWVSGACMLVRNRLFADIGLMDEKYFLYFEEVDLCRRANSAGWQCWHVPASRLVHLEGSSTGISNKMRRRAGYWFDSRRRFFVKFYGIAGLILADMSWAIGRISFLVRAFMRIGNPGKSDHTPRWFMFDLLWGDVKTIITGKAREILKDRLKA